MTNRTRSNTVRIETEIEKCREESNWTKVIELAEQLKEKSPNYECLSNFLIGEGKLEKYLEEYPPTNANIHRAKLGLIESKKYLQLAANELGRKAGVALDAHLLLGKLHYACGQYSDSLKSYNLAELQVLTEKKLPVDLICGSKSHEAVTKDETNVYILNKKFAFCCLGKLAYLDFYS